MLAPRVFATTNQDGGYRVIIKFCVYIAKDIFFFEEKYLLKTTCLFGAYLLSDLRYIICKYKSMLLKWKIYYCVMFSGVSGAFVKMIRLKARKQELVAVDAWKLRKISAWDRGPSPNQGNA